MCKRCKFKFKEPLGKIITCNVVAFNDKDGFCILHSKNENKDPKMFEDAFKFKFDKQEKEEDEINFNSVTFVIPIDFSNKSFEKKIIFQNCKFLSEVNFSGCEFKGEVNFSDSIFEKEVYITTFQPKEKINEIKYTTFYEYTNFQKVTFNGFVNFTNARFEKEVDFNSSKFNDITYFCVTKFNSKADFNSIEYQGEFDFKEARFEKEADFNSSKFNNEIEFFHTTFNGETRFNSIKFKENINFQSTTFNNEINFSNSIFQKEAIFEKTNFLGNVINFSHAEFKDKVNFIDIETLAHTSFDFSNSSFYGRALFRGKEKRLFKNVEVDFSSVFVDSKAPIDFNSVDLSKWIFAHTNLREFRFSDVKFDEKDGRLSLYEKLKDDINESRKNNIFEKLYRELRCNYENQKDYFHAGDFYYWEREYKLKRLKNKEEHSKDGNEFILFLYKFFSGYGESVKNSLISLGFLWLYFAFVYMPSENNFIIYSFYSFINFYNFNFLYIFDTNFTFDFFYKPLVNLESFGKALLHSLQVMCFVRPFDESDKILQFNNNIWFLTAEVIQRIISPIFITLLILAIRQRVKR